jgi:hypothetical protein
VQLATPRHWDALVRGDRVEQSTPANAETYPMRWIMKNTKSFLAQSWICTLALLGVACSAESDLQGELGGQASDPGTEAPATIEQNLCTDIYRYATAFRGNNGRLWVDANKQWSGDTGGMIFDKTNPSIAQLQNKQYVVAFSGNSCNGCLGGNLWITVGTANSQSGYDATTTYTHKNISPTTSPSVVRLPDNGYAVAYQDLDNELWVFSKHPNGSTQLDHAMCSGTPCKIRSDTSPSTTLRDDGTYEVAFQGTDGRLWFYGPTWGGRQSVYGMLPGTSPSIGWNSYYPDDATAFNSNINNLWIVDGVGFEDRTNQAMAANTSPSIATTSTTYEVAYVNPSSKLCTWVEGGSANCSVLTGGVALRANTSPSVAVWSGGRYQIAAQGGDGYLYYAGPACSKTSKQKQKAYLNNGSSPSIATAELAW